MSKGDRDDVRRMREEIVSIEEARLQELANWLMGVVEQQDREAGV